MNKRVRNDAILRYNKKIYKKLRLEIMELLGGILCKKCGYAEDMRALVFDHIKGGGTKERKKYGFSTISYLKRLLKDPEKTKKEIQVLCANCNIIKIHTNNESKKTKLY